MNDCCKKWEDAENVQVYLKGSLCYSIMKPGIRYCCECGSSLKQEKPEVPEIPLNPSKRVAELIVRQLGNCVKYLMQKEG